MRRLTLLLAILAPVAGRADRAVVVPGARPEVLDLSPDDRRLAVGTDEGAVLVADAATGRVLKRLGGDAILRGVAFERPSGERVAVATSAGFRVGPVAVAGRFGRVASCDGDFVVGDEDLPGARVFRADGAERARLRIDGPVGYYAPVACDGARVAVAGLAAVHLFEGGRARKLPVALPKDDALRDVALAGGRVAALSNFGEVTVWDAATGAVIAWRDAVGGQAGQLALGRDVLVAGPAVLDLRDLRLRRRLYDRRAAGASRFARDGRTLFVGHARDVGVYDVDAPRRPPFGHLDIARSMALDGDVLATGTEGRVHLWNVADPRPGLAGPGPLARVIAVPGRATVALHGGRVFAGAAGAVRAFDVATGAPAGAWRLARETPWAEVPALVVRRGRVYAAGDTHVYLIEPAQPFANVVAGPFERGASGGVHHLDVHPDGRHLAVAWGDRGAAVWADGRKVRDLPAITQGYDTVLRFSPRGDALLRTWSMSRGTLWPWPSLAPAREFEAAWPNDLAWAPDGGAFAWVSWARPGIGVTGVDGADRWRVESDGIERAAVAWDARRGVLYSTGDEGAIHVHDAATGRTRAVWAAEMGPHVQALRFSADGRRLLVGVGAGFAALWDVDGGPPVRLSGAWYDGEDHARVDVDGVVIAQAQGVTRRWGPDGAPPPEQAPLEYDWRPAGLHGDTAVHVSATGEVLRAHLRTGARERLRPLKGAVVGRAALAADGRRLLVAGEFEGDVVRAEMWDLETGARLGATTFPDAAVRGLWFVGDRALIETGGETPPVWWTPGQAPVPACPGLGNPEILGVGEAHLAFARDAVVVTSLDCAVRHTFLVETPRAVAFSGAQIAIGTFRGVVTLHDLATGAKRGVLRHFHHGLWSRGGPPAPAPL